MLTNEDRKEIYEGVMSKLTTLVENILTEKENDNASKEVDNADIKVKGDYTFVNDFMNNVSVSILAKRMENNNIEYAQVWLFDNIEDDEYDAYTFLFTRKDGKIAFLKRTAKAASSEQAKKNLEANMKDFAGESVVRDIYVEDGDINSMIENIAEEDDFKKSLLASLWPDKDKEDDSETKEEKKEPMSGDKMSKAKHITALLKKIAEDDESFDEVVKLFNTIETLAKKHNSFTYALSAINDRTNLKPTNK